MTGRRTAGRHRRRCGEPWWAGWARFGFVVVLVASGLAIGTTTAAARTSATTPDGGDYATRLRFDVSAIEPTLVTSTGPNTVTITGTMTNTGADELTDLSYRIQRGDPLRSTAAVHDEIASPSEPVAAVPSSFTPMTGTLAAGASAPFVFTTAITGPSGLDVTRPGVYPIMVNVNGGVVLQDGPLEARIGELHLLLTVMGVPGSTATGPATPGAATSFNFVWPMVDVPHLGVDGVFLNDDLRTSISPGGRLATLLDGLTGDATATLPAGALTLVLDPQLLDELDRMTGQYRVVSPDGTAQPPVTAIESARVPPTPAATSGDGTTGSTAPAETGTASDSTPAGQSAAGTPVDSGGGIPGTIGGTGQQAAASFLERLRAVAATHPVVMLPYGDPDVVALVRAGMSADVAAATEHGREVTRRVWGDLATVTTPSATSMVYPIDGATDDATVTTLVGDGATAGLLSQASVTVPSGADGRPTTAAVIEADQGAAALPSVIAQTDVLGGLDKLIDERQTGWAARVNSLTALLAQQRVDGVTTPAVFAPTRRWSPDASALAGLVQLLGELGRSGVIAGTSLDALTGAAGQTGTTDYPEAARDRELSASYLQRITAARTAIAALRADLASVDQPVDPAAVLDPLDDALSTAASTAFRTDPDVGEANLGTVESTVDGIRSGVQIASSSTNYTLASSSSPLVLTVQNTTPYDVPVTVALTGGEMVGLTTTEQPVQVIPAGRSQQVKIPTEVTRSGQFQVTATLVGPDGTAWGSPVQLTVQSSAYGALTVILIAVAGGVLVVMVALRIRQRLRARRARIAAAGQPAAAPAPDQRPGPGPAEADGRPSDDRPLVSGPRAAHQDQNRQEFRP